MAQSHFYANKLMTVAGLENQKQKKKNKENKYVWEWIQMELLL